MPESAPTAWTEEVALERARRGDGAAFEWLVRQYQDRVYNAVLRLCPHEADALDLTQTAFLKAYEALPRFAGRARFYTWIFRIAVNQALSHRRQSARRRRHAESAMQSQPPLQFVDPAAQAESAELQRALTAALDRLSGEFRAAVVLRDVEGMDYSDIAAVLGVPVGTVKSRIARGRGLLREMLANAEGRP
jgi:RNA polymerase sigma-70 factor (ECF subfamily)